MERSNNNNPAAVLFVIIGSLLLVAVAVFSFFRIYYSSGLGKNSIPAAAENSVLIDASYKILGYIKDDDFAALSKIAHPSAGVLFSPYATVSPSAAKTFTPAQIRAFAGDGTNYVWGLRDGDAAPIDMSPRDYFSEFVWDRDYTHAEIVGVNRVAKTGNALENLTDVRPEIRFIDFHIPPEIDGGDWSSLRLGFEEHDGYLMLTVILHSEKTV